MAGRLGMTGPRARRVVVVAAALFLVGALAPATGASVRTAALEKGFSAPDVRWVPGEVVVQYRVGTSAVQRGSVRASHGMRLAARVPSFGVELLELERGVSVRAAIRALLADRRVATAEPNFLYERMEAPVPNDPFFGSLWGLRNTGQTHGISDPAGGFTTSIGTADADMDVTNAWDPDGLPGTPPDFGSPQTVIAVIDDGVDVAHQDLAGQMWVNPGEIAGNGIDDDGNGKIDDVFGWDVAEDDATLLAPASVPGGNSHGTHVAGTIAAAVGNATGVAGVCPGCRIMVLKVMDDSGGISNAALIAALAYAKAQGADIANLSLGGPSWSNALRQAIKESGLLAVVAAGNDSLDNDMFLAADTNGDGSSDAFAPAFPASHDLSNILAVAASNDKDEYAYFTGCFLVGGQTTNARHGCAFTSWGHDSVDVAAPGVDIRSTVPGNAYAFFNGTSMATPNTAGAAALVKSANPTFTPVQVKNAIMNGTDSPATLAAMFSAFFSGPGLVGDFTRTSGRVNAFTALTASTANATTKSDGSIAGAKSMGKKKKVIGTLAFPADANDVLEKKLAKKKRYRIVVDGPPGADFDLIVYGPGTVEIWQIRGVCPGRDCPLAAISANSGAGIDEAIVFKTKKKGTYFFHVASFFGNGSYTLRVKRLP